MENSEQIERLKSYITDIFEACKDDPLRTEIAVLNLKALSNSIKEYEKAPKYYNAMLEEKSQSNYISITKDKFDLEYKVPIVGELEKIYGKKLKHVELQKLGRNLSKALCLTLRRDVLRSKALLIKWFSVNWTSIRPKIFELNLDKMDFDDYPNP